MKFPVFPVQGGGVFPTPGRQCPSAVANWRGEKGEGAPSNWGDLYRCLSIPRLEIKIITPLNCCTNKPCPVFLPSLWIKPSFQGTLCLRWFHPRELWAIFKQEQHATGKRACQMAASERLLLSLLGCLSALLPPPEATERKAALFFYEPLCMSTWAEWYLVWI